MFGSFLSGDAFDHVGPARPPSCLVGEFVDCVDDVGEFVALEPVAPDRDGCVVHLGLGPHGCHCEEDFVGFVRCHGVHSLSSRCLAMSKEGARLRLLSCGLGCCMAGSHGCRVHRRRSVVRLPLRSSACRHACRTQPGHSGPIRFQAGASDRTTSFPTVFLFRKANPHNVCF